MCLSHDSISLKRNLTQASVVTLCGDGCSGHLRTRKLFWLPSTSSNLTLMNPLQYPHLAVRFKIMFSFSFMHQLPFIIIESLFRLIVSVVGHHRRGGWPGWLNFFIVLSQTLRLHYVRPQMFFCHYNWGFARHTFFSVGAWFPLFLTTLFSERKMRLDKRDSAVVKFAHLATN